MVWIGLRSALGSTGPRPTSIELVDAEVAMIDLVEFEVAWVDRVDFEVAKSPGGP